MDFFIRLLFFLHTCFVSIPTSYHHTTFISALSLRSFFFLLRSFIFSFFSPPFFFSSSLFHFLFLFSALFFSSSLFHFLFLFSALFFFFFALSFSLSFLRPFFFFFHHTTMHSLLTSYFLSFIVHFPQLSFSHFLFCILLPLSHPLSDKPERTGSLDTGKGWLWNREEFLSRKWLVESLVLTSFGNLPFEKKKKKEQRYKKKEKSGSVSVTSVWSKGDNRQSDSHSIMGQSEVEEKRPGHDSYQSCDPFSQYGGTVLKEEITLPRKLSRKGYLASFNHRERFCFIFVLIFVFVAPSFSFCTHTRAKKYINPLRALYLNKDKISFYWQQVFTALLS